MAKQNRISVARSRLKLGQSELAAQLGVHRSTVTRWENGTASIPKPILLLIDQMESSAPTPSSSEAA